MRLRQGDSKGEGALHKSHRARLLPRHKTTTAIQQPQHTKRSPTRTETNKKNAQRQNEPDNWIATKKTLDAAGLGAAGVPPAALSLPDEFAYMGMAHPPPPTGPAQCALPWTAPFQASYADATARSIYGDTLSLTMCNWYLPQGAGVLGAHRFLWQVQYLVSQGFYVFLDYHPTASTDPNVEDPSLLAANWGALWRALKALPNYDSRLRGRVVADVVNEARCAGSSGDAGDGRRR